MRADPVSIHYRQRWFYVLWSVLLVSSCVLLGLWVRPARSGSGILSVQVKFQDIPEGASCKVWLGPRGAWKHRRWNGDDACLEKAFQGSVLDLGNLSVPIAYRRWQGFYIPSRTSDLLVLRITPPSGETRYFAYSLREDLDSGMIRPGKRLRILFEKKWAQLPADVHLL
jgi:hypothetical protein